MNMNPLTLEYLHKAHEQEINKNLKFNQIISPSRNKVCIDLKLIKFCI